MIIANFEREVYNWGVNRYDLKRKDLLVLMPWPKCQTINAFTMDKGPTSENLTCKECGFDLSKEYQI